MASIATPTTADEAVEPKEIVTLKERGPQLPLGVFGADEQLHRGIACRSWTGAEERVIGQIREDTKESGDFPTRLLAHMFTTIGPHNFETMEDAARRVVVSQMFLGDALYCYVWLRTQTIGHLMRMDMTCPACRFDFEYEADLNTLEIRTAETVEAVTWEYRLKHPFEIRGHKVEGFELAPTRWSTMERVVQGAILNKVSTKLDMIQGCVTKILGQNTPIVLTDAELDGMSKFDIESLSSLINDREVGPDMSISEKCPRCKRRFYESLDWGYDSFFGVSSPRT